MYKISGNNSPAVYSKFIQFNILHRIGTLKNQPGLTQTPVFRRVLILGLLILVVKKLFNYRFVLVVQKCPAEFERGGKFARIN